MGVALLPVTAWAQKDYPIKPVSFTHVQVVDSFWAPKIDVNRSVTIPYVLAMCRKEGRIDNFLKAAGKEKADKMTDFPFDDTDLYKVIEGASYGLQVKRDPKLEREVDTLIGYIAAAQEPDGYLYTFRTAKPAKPHEWIGAKRWEKEEELSHELYNAGHLYEAAVAHYQATGKKTMLNIALKNADLLVRTFGYGKVEEWPGHQVVEIGLVKLYRVTGEKKYLDLAKFFLDVRNHGQAYSQSDRHVTQQHEAEGHAVRAAYMYTGMADVAALTGDTSYLNAIDDIWDDVVNKKLYITGGIGATGAGEAFGDAYDLPNMSAYAETCAAIANVYWNSRMFLLHGDSKYVDVLEKTLYNGLLSGVSLSGNRFFYPNPLASMGQHARSAWFACACCISNVSRFMASVPGYVYAQNGNDLFVNLFMSNKASIQLPAANVTLEEETDYPWKGLVAFTVKPSKAVVFALKIRIPGWAQDQPVPGDLYHFASSRQVQVPITVNGKAVDYVMEHGYAVLKRTWKTGDKVVVDFPMDVKKVLANDKVKADKGRFALQMGPVMYCLEGVDQKDSTVQSIVVDSSAVLARQYQRDMLKGIVRLQTQGVSSSRQPNSDEIVKTAQTVTAIPYYSWDNRGSGEMEVWIPYEASAARPKPAMTIAAKSKVTSSLMNARMLKALNDQYDPADSKDNSALYMHWWPKKNTQEWIQYDFDSTYTISESQVYWFDDGPWGGCRVPASWSLLYKKDGEWVPVKATTPYETVKDRYDVVHFEPVTTTALRMAIQLPVDNATGVHEWIVK